MYRSDNKFIKLTYDVNIITLITFNFTYTRISKNMFIDLYRSVT